MDIEPAYLTPHPTNSWIYAPKSPEPYEYSPLAKSEIRLLFLLPGQGDDHVRCYLQNVSLPDRPVYETISYAWGDPNITTTIESEGKTIQVTTNLHSALMHLRHESDQRIIWADAVCINQQDIAERSVQVTLMGEIYAKSSQVIVWLGEETQETDKSFDQLQKLDEFFVENEEGYRTDPKRWEIIPVGGSSSNFVKLRKNRSEWEAPVTNIAKIHWFVRRWVVQEVAKAPSAIVVIGKKQIPWVTLAEVFWSLYKSGLFITDEVLEGQAKIRDGVQSILCIEFVRRDSINTYGSPLLELIISTRQFQCFNPRDVVYSQLGIINDLGLYNQAAPLGSDAETQTLWNKLTLSPNYTSSIEEIYHQLVLINIIKLKSLLPLSAAYVLPGNPTLNLPSWVPDFSNLHLANPLMHLRNESALPFQATKGTTLQARFTNDYKTLHIMGRIIDIVQDIAPLLEDVPLTPEWEALSTEENWDLATINVKKLRLWLRGCLKFFNPVSGEGKILGLTPEQLDVFSRTLVCNLTSQGDTPPPEWLNLVHEYLDLVISKEKWAKKWIVPLTEEGLQISLDRMFLVENSMSMRASGWQFAVTEKGLMGRVLTGTRKGDKIVLFGGGEVPYVLREREEGGWVFVASCYLHGMMDGEGLALEEVVDEEFALH